MKKILLGIAFFYLLPNFLIAQCPEEGLHLRCQEDLSNFILNYPDCTEIESLTLVYCDENECNNCLNSLEGLDKILKIRDYLYFMTLTNDQFTNLKGLSNLTEIGGIILMPMASPITDFTGLESLKKIGGIECPYCPLKSLNGLNNVEEITGNIYFGDAARLENTNALSSLKTVGGNITITNSLNSFNLDSLVNVGGYIELWGTSITELNGLNRLRAINYINITNNRRLIEVNGFQSLDSLDSLGSLIFDYNRSLKSVTGFSELKYVNRFILTENDSLTNISGLNNVEEINSNLTIKNNAQLSDCSIESICDHLQNNGSYTIENNEEGCNSAAEILERCVIADKPATGSFTCE